MSFTHNPAHFNLQATLSASSASGNNATVTPHHPITCTAEGLAFYEDGRFACAHAEVGADDERTTHCLQQSMALLVMEMAAQWHIQPNPTLRSGRDETTNTAADETTDDRLQPVLGQVGGGEVSVA